MAKSSLIWSFNLKNKQTFFSKKGLIRFAITSAITFDAHLLYGPIAMNVFYMKK